MILQYSTMGTECYEEAQSICVLHVFLTNEKDVGDIIFTASEKIETVWGHPVFESREENITPSDSKAVKIAVLNDRNRTNGRALMFSGNTTLYLLNENGKTIKRF